MTSPKGESPWVARRNLLTLATEVPAQRLAVRSSAKGG